MPKPNHTPKATQTCRQIVFEDFLQKWFDELYPTNEGQPRKVRPAQMDRVADVVYEGRPRLTATEVAEILRSQAPEPWCNPEACIGVGTIILRAPKAIERAREAFRELKLALAQMVSEGQTERSAEDHLTFLSTIGEHNFRTRNMRLISEITEILNDFENNPRFRNLRERSSPPWQVEAVLLYDKYLEIVGQPIAVANRAAAVRFVQAMLDRLKVAQVTVRAIEQVLERGVQALRERGIDTRTTKEGGIKSRPTRHPTE